MRKQFLLQITFIALFIGISFSLESYLNLHSQLNRSTTHLFAIGYWLSLYCLLHLNGFRFKYLLQKIKLERIKYIALLFYPIIIYSIVHRSNMQKLITFSIFTKVISIAMVVIVLISPFYMGDNQTKEN